MYNGKPIFYSLGNFIFDQSNTQTHSAYFVKIDLVNNTGKCSIYPIYISNYLPQYMNSDDGKALLKGLNPNSNQLEITDEEMISTPRESDVSLTFESESSEE